MAMRLYTRQELEQELREKWKLTPTKHRSGTTTAWRTPNGLHVLVPDFPKDARYPDYIVDRIVEQLVALGENPLRKTDESKKP